MPRSAVIGESGPSRTKILWLGLRLTTFVVATLAFILEDRSRIHLPLRTILLEPWYRYDVRYYVRILNVGYQTGEITSGFHPLFPWAAALLNSVLHQPLICLLIVSSLAGLLLTISFYWLARIDQNHHTASTATALLLCWPAAASIFVPYTESLFLLLSVWCLLAARKGKFWIAGAAGFFASLTRQHGIFLALPLAWELWEQSDRNLRAFLRRWHTALTIFIVPAGYLAWILYRAFAINDVHPDFSSAQHFIYSVMISPTHYQVFQNQQFLPPWIAAWKAAKVLWNGHVHWSAYGDVLLAGIFLIGFILTWRTLRTSYLIYSLAVILIGLSLYTGQDVNPYTSLPRHLYMAFPVFIGIASRYRFSRLSFILTVLCLCQLLVLCCFVWQTWVL